MAEAKRKGRRWRRGRKQERIVGRGENYGDERRMGKRRERGGK